MVAQRGVDATLGRPGVGTDGIDLGKYSHVVSRLSGSDGRSQPGQTAADDQDVVMRKCSHFLPPAS
jgi:hypothetical protein